MTRVSSKNRPPAMKCPHCNGKADIRTSRAVTATYHEIRYRCRNDACGCVFVASLEAIRVTVQSAAPNPEIRLPFMVRGRTPEPANDDLPVTPPPAANDDAMSETG